MNYKYIRVFANLLTLISTRPKLLAIVHENEILIIDE